MLKKLPTFTEDEAPSSNLVFAEKLKKPAIPITIIDNEAENYRRLPVQINTK